MKVITQENKAEFTGRGKTDYSKQLEIIEKAIAETKKQKDSIGVNLDGSDLGEIKWGLRQQILDRFKVKKAVMKNRNAKGKNYGSVSIEW